MSNWGENNVSRAGNTQKHVGKLGNIASATKMFLNLLGNILASCMGSKFCFCNNFFLWWASSETLIGNTMFPQQYFLVFPGRKSLFSYFVRVYVVVLKLSNVDDDNTRDRSSEIIVGRNIFKCEHFQTDLHLRGPSFTSQR